VVPGERIELPTNGLQSRSLPVHNGARGSVTNSFTL